MDRRNLRLLMPQLRPNHAECIKMMSDLQAIAGPWWAAVMIGLTLPRFRQSLAGRPITGPRAALLWQVWSRVCRPGQVTTIFDMTTFGRFTRSGGPENAGKPILRARK